MPASTSKELCRSSRELFLEEVGTTCGSGWVSDENAILLMILGAKVDPPATAGGTDVLQARLTTIKAKHK